MLRIYDKRTKTWRIVFFGFVFVQLFTLTVFAQTKTVKPAAIRVTQVDGEKLKALLKPNGKPLLVNFWATWCEPCREEFPDLVKIDAEYKGKLDFITVSLDDLAEINADVPKFLTEKKAEMPSFLLKTTDEDAVISSVSKDWKGSLPFTILYDKSGKVVYSTALKVKIPALRAAIEKTFVETPVVSVVSEIQNLPLVREFYTYENGVADAKKDIATGKLVIRYYGFRPVSGDEAAINKSLKKEYGIEINDVGCSVADGYHAYAEGYNEISLREIKRRFGNDYLEKAIGKASQ